MIYREMLSTNTKISISKTDIFVFVHSNTSTIPNQGWKIHISALNKDYHRILNIVVPYLINHKISFKFLKDKKELSKINSKLTHIFSFAKFITIYLENEDQLKKHIQFLYENTKGFKGLPIYSDRRYLDSNNIYYRYGTNLKNYKYIRDNNNKAIYKDRNALYYSLPNFIKEPFPNNKSVILFKDQEVNNRFSLLYIVHYTSTSSVFLGFDKVENNYIIVKTSPIYGLFGSRKSVIWFRKNEVAILQHIKEKQIKNSNQLIDYFVDNNQFYLFKSYVKGRDLGHLFSANDIFKNIDNLDNVANKYMLLLENIFACISNFHKYNIILNDVSVKNFICNDDLCSFIDLESSYIIGSKFEKLIYSTTLFNFKFPLHTVDNHFALDILKMATIFCEFWIGQMQNMSKPKNIKWMFLKVYNFILFYQLNLQIVDKLLAIFNQFLSQKFALLEVKPSFSKTTLKTEIDKIWSFFTNNRKLANKKEYKNEMKQFIYKLLVKDKIDSKNLEKIKKQYQSLKFEKLGKFKSENLIFWAIWAGYQKDFLLAHKIIKYIWNKRITEINNQYYIKYKDFLIPYLWGGSLGLALAMSIVDKAKYQDKINLIEKTVLPYTSQKIDIFFGISGFILYFKWKYNFQKYSQNILKWTTFLINIWDRENNFFVRQHEQLQKDDYIIAKILKNLSKNQLFATKYLTFDEQVVAKIDKISNLF
ncbi:hypothetical protein [Mesomycoplasma conjunctivae]|uniref:class III lanthionine synthetase LanKC N-terminal domain-containing protein n=1 Tax=Mesomycoplasma conjunctivae TaxID=45361 RepID=UPI003DA69368